MLHLVSAIISSVLVSFLTRLAKDRSRNENMRLAVNYATCFTLGLVLESGKPASFHDGMAFTLFLAAFAGLLYLFSFVLLKESIKSNGVGISSLFMKLGLIATVLLSFVLFDERISAAKAAAIAITLLSVALLNRTEGEEKAHDLRLLLMLLLFGGLSDLPLKMFEYWGNAETMGLFLPSAFLVAFLVSVALTMMHHERMSKYDALFGFLIGIPNYLSSFFLLRALYDLPATIAYPIYSGSAVLILFLLGKLAFREKTGKKEIVPMVLLFSSLIMLSV